MANDPLILLDTSQPFDESKVMMLDDVVRVMYGGQNRDRDMAHQVLSELKRRPDSWQLVKVVLLYSTEANTKFYALSILEDCIQSRWKVLSEEQKGLIKQCVTQMAVDAATDKNVNTERYLSSKINETLVHIVKQDWPHSWPNFMPEMCTAAKTNQRLCRSVMEILCILSEEIFEFGEDELTSKKARELMISMTAQFQQVYELCLFIIQNYISQASNLDVALVSATLRCLSHFLKWIPFGFIFQTNLIDLILDNFWESTNFRVDCLRCLTEIVSLKDLSAQKENEMTTEGDNSDVEVAKQQKIKLHELWLKVITNLTSIPEQTVNYEETATAHSRMFWELFYQHLALFLTTFLKNHRETVCEEVAQQSSKGQQLLIFAMNLLVRITRIQHDATFKICLDYWHHISESLFFEVQQRYRISRSYQQQLPDGAATQAFLNLAASNLSDNIQQSSINIDEPIDNPSIYSERLQMYDPIFNKLRHVIVRRMAKPPEVYVNYDEETQTVDRDYQPDTDEIALYNTLRQILVLLTNLNGESTQNIMEDILLTEAPLQESSIGNWNPMPLNRLCWSIGAISGAMSIQREKAFLVKVLRRLLQLCEAKKGKENKAVVASQLMYIIGQYSRFLNIHIKFLQVLIQKLFEFMHDKFPGVQDMACETFLKVCQKCRKKISTASTSENCTTAVSNDDITNGTKVYLLDNIIPQVLQVQGLLEATKQRLMLYEAIGYCISAAAPNLQALYVKSLMSWANEKWYKILNDTSSNPSMLMLPDVAKSITEILRLNERAAFATGDIFFEQLMTIYDDMLKIYGYYSTQISVEVEQSGVAVMGYAKVKHLRAVKRETLRLIDTFISVAVNEDPLSRLQIKQRCLPPMLHSVLEDYKLSVSQAKDYEVLLLLTTLIKRLNAEMVNELTTIFNCVFDCTLELIKYDFNTHPDIRSHFYDFLNACTTYCFEGLFTLPDGRLRNLVESFVWAFKHEQPGIADLGLRTMMRFLTSLVELKPDVVVPFFDAYYYTILKEIIGVITDTLHKAGLKSQTLILRHLILVVDRGVVNCPESGICNITVRQRLGMFLLDNFPNLNAKQVEAFVVDLFNWCEDVNRFQRQVRDFVVQLKEFSGSDELFEPEREEALQRAKQREEERLMTVPGIRPQWESVLSAMHDEER